MSSHIAFYATRNDMLALAAALQKQADFQFVRFAWHRTATPKALGDFRDIKDLGMADADSASGCKNFLVVRKGTQIKVRDMGGLPFTERYSIDQLENPDSLVFSAGGEFNSDILISGSFGSASESKGSAQLVRMVRKVISSEFEKIKAFYVGPEAAKALRSGKRLVMNAKAPRIYDLSLAE